MKILKISKLLSIIKSSSTYPGVLTNNKLITGLNLSLINCKGFKASFLFTIPDLKAVKTELNGLKHMILAQLKPEYQIVLQHFQKCFLRKLLL